MKVLGYFNALSWNPASSNWHSVSIRYCSLTAPCSVIFKIYIVYYRLYTAELQSAVDHSKKNYQCEMSACPYTGTSIIQKLPWTGQAGADTQLSRAHQDEESHEDYDEESHEEHDEESDDDYDDESDEDYDEESDENNDKSGSRRLLKTGLNKIKRMFRT